MNIERLAIPEVLVVTPVRHGDSRGFFSETWKQSAYAEAGIPGPFIQDNHAASTSKYVVRGLHCQIGPNAQGKLVRVVRGAIWDVAVDARRGSPTFGHRAGAELTADNWKQLWCPPGFLHGYCTLTEDTEVIYKVTAPYDRAAERGAIWNDPTLAVPWPIDPAAAVLSEKDLLLPRWSGQEAWF